MENLKVEYTIEFQNGAKVFATKEQHTQIIESVVNIVTGKTSNYLGESKKVEEVKVKKTRNRIKKKSSNKVWTQEEKVKVSELLNLNSYSSTFKMKMNKIAYDLGRSKNAVSQQLGLIRREFRGTGTDSKEQESKTLEVGVARPNFFNRG